jgi:hypothetical protein
MNAWLRRLLLVLTIGGGFVGVLLTIPFLAQADKVIAYVMVIAFVALYGYGIFLGLKLSEGVAPLRALRVYFALQIPFISSPLVAYRFSTGFQTTIAIGQSRLAVDWRLGSEGQFALFSSAPLGIGLNIVALAIVLLLYSRLVEAPEHSSVQRPNQGLEPTASRSDL